jgi:two-component system, chemotaxis family, sensor kinase CheA
MTDEFRTSFIEEALELLNQLETDLLQLEEDAGNVSIIDSIFRLMHNLKGNAGMFGFEKVQDLTHEFESLYDRIKAGKLKITTEIIGVTLRGKDAIMAMLDNTYSGEEDVMITAILKRLLSGEIDSAEVVHELSGDIAKNFAILFTPDSNIFERGLDPDKAILEILQVGRSHSILHEKGKAWSNQKLEKECHTKWEIYLNTTLTLNEVKEIFLFYDPDEYSVFEISKDLAGMDPAFGELIASFYPEKVISPTEHIKEQLEFLDEVRQPESEKSEEPDLQSSKNTTDASKTDTANNTIHVSSNKLDELMNLVSELVISAASIEVHGSRFNDAKLNNSIENLERLTKKFRNNALEMRLIPVGTLLSKFKRQARDLSKSLDKSVNVIIDGQNIEIDKTILKSIENPLMHIIRNSIDHGIESPQERVQKGKPEEGQLKISVFYSGANVVIQIQDDGRGINLEKVRECAIKKGYIDADQPITNEELLQLILEPGFSTSDNVSIVSGRGVGMDVVRKELNAVSGSIEIDTEKDLGTSITLKLPTTLSIIDTLMIEVDHSPILIPLLDVEYCYSEKRSNLYNQDSRFVQYKNNLLPFLSLREKFSYPNNENESEMVIIINKFDKRYAVIADRLIGEHQAVIKPLGELFINQPYFSGGSIMVDGKLALILDTNFLFNQIATN